MNNIEDDIKKCKEITSKCDDCKFAACEQCEINWTDIQAIKIVLGNLEALCDMQKSADRELENAKKINEEHRKENADLMKAINVVEKEKGEWIEDCNNLKKKVKELEEENGSLKRVNNIIKNIDIENAAQKIDDYYNEFMRNFIPKQKIKNKIEEYYKKMEEDNKNISWIITDRIVLNVLEELLQEEDK